MTICVVLFMQTVPLVPPADFIRDHSTMVAWVIGALLAIIVAQTVGAIHWIHGEFKNLRLADADMTKSLGSKIVTMTSDVNNASISRYDHFLATQKETEAKIDSLDGRVTTVEKTLEVYKEHVGAGDAALSKIAENQVTQLSALADMKIENINAHGAIIAGRTTLIERLTSVEARSDALMQRISAVNGTGGDLKVVAETLKVVAQRLEAIAARALIVEKASKPARR